MLKYLLGSSPKGLSLQEAAIVTGAVALAGFLTSRATREGWLRVTGDEPPLDPSEPGTDISEAVTWAVVSGVVIGLAKLFARRTLRTRFRAAKPRVVQSIDESNRKRQIGR